MELLKPVSAEDIQKLLDTLCNASKILESKMKNNELLKAQQFILEALMIVDDQRKRIERE
jgi:hypothetical protein